MTRGTARITSFAPSRSRLRTSGYRPIISGRSPSRGYVLKHRRIFVLGSANMDLVFALDGCLMQARPLTGSDLALFPGGKGANQACAAGKLGGRTTMVARIGGDSFGARLLTSLSEAGVDVNRVRQCARPTGCASIYVLPKGENSIVISPGANASLEAPGAVADIEDIENGDILLSQLETPIESVQAAFEYARARGAVTILDPAPARALPTALLDATDFITPNQTEAATLLGELDRSITTSEEEACAPTGLWRSGLASPSSSWVTAAACIRTASGTLPWKHFE